MLSTRGKAALNQSAIDFRLKALFAVKWALKLGSDCLLAWLAKNIEFPEAEQLMKGSTTSSVHQLTSAISEDDIDQGCPKE